MSKLFDLESKLGKSFALLIQGLIILSLITFSFSTLPDLSENTRTLLSVLEAITIIIFTIEYALRIILEPQKLRYIFSFYGIVDLAAIVPFYIASGYDLRAIRSFYLIRLLRIFKLFKYNSAFQRLRRAWMLVREEMILFGCMTLLMLYLAAVGIYYFENQAQPEVFKSVFHGMWWAVATLTTVGYGDVYPITAGGKLFTFIILMLGLGVVAVPTGLLASALSQVREEN